MVVIQDCHLRVERCRSGGHVRIRHGRLRHLARLRLVASSGVEEDCALLPILIFFEFCVVDGIGRERA